MKSVAPKPRPLTRSSLTPIWFTDRRRRRALKSCGRSRMKIMEVAVSPAAISKGISGVSEPMTRGTNNGGLDNEQIIQTDFPRFHPRFRFDRRGGAKRARAADHRAKPIDHERLALL